MQIADTELLILVVHLSHLPPTEPRWEPASYALLCILVAQNFYYAVCFCFLFSTSFSTLPSTKSLPKQQHKQHNDVKKKTSEQRNATQSSMSSPSSSQDELRILFVIFLLLWIGSSITFGRELQMELFWRKNNNIRNSDWCWKTIQMDWQSNRFFQDQWIGWW